MHVNYSAPHSQNRLSEASFLLMWLLRRINSAAQSYECEHSTPVRQNCATLNSLHVKTATSHKFSAQRIVGKAFTGHTQEIFKELQKSLGLVYSGSPLSIWNSNGSANCFNTASS